MMTKTWKRVVKGTAVVAGFAVGALLLVAVRPAVANVMSGGVGGMMSGGMMMSTNMGAMHANMRGTHETMVAMHDQETAEAAALLGMSVDDLNKALADGKPIGALADQQNVDPAQVAETLAAVRKAALRDLVTAGTLTQAQADWMLQQMEANGMMVPMGGMMPAGCTQATPTTY